MLHTNTLFRTAILLLSFAITKLFFEDISSEYQISSVIRQKAEFQNGCFKKTKLARFSENELFYPLIRTRIFINNVGNFGQGLDFLFFFLLEDQRKFRFIFLKIFGVMEGPYTI